MWLFLTLFLLSDDIHKTLDLLVSGYGWHKPITAHHVVQEDRKGFDNNLETTCTFEVGNDWLKILWLITRIAAMTTTDDWLSAIIATPIPVINIKTLTINI